MILMLVVDSHEVEVPFTVMSY